MDMKINLYSASLKSRKILALEALVQQMKVAVKSHQIEQLRLTRAFFGGKLTSPYCDKIPWVGFAAVFRTREGREILEQYNGLVLLELNHLATRSEAEAWKARLRSYPQVQLAFVGCSGLSVKFLVRFTRTDGSLPTDAESAQRFHAVACRRALEFFRMQLDSRVLLRSDQLDARCRFTYDPQIYVNSETLPIRMDQPTATGEEVEWEHPLFEQDFKTPDQEAGGHFFQSNEELRSYYFASSLLEALKVGHQEDPAIYRRNFIQAFMKGCFASGVEEEQGIDHLLRYGCMHEHESEVRALFRAGYEVEKHFGEKPALPKVQKDTLELIHFMNRRYEIRRNTLNNRMEYRKRLSYYTPFIPIDKLVLNTMSLDALSEGLKVWDRDISRYVYSSRIPAYNPIDKYLSDLPVWDGKDYIRELAGQVPCENQELWISNFYTWFLGMVAGWKQMSKQHANSTLPLLIGDQACGKSTFCKRILPPELQEYYTDSIDIAKKQEAMLALTRYMLINIDEFDSVSTSYQSFLKHIVQKPVVNIRKPYESSNTQLRRYSSFIATCNNEDLLSDPTGSRRYLCVKIEGIIDNTTPINYPQLFAQAVAALNQGEQYWFDVSHAKETTEANRQFDQRTTEENLLLHYFAVAETEKEGSWMSPTEIYLYIGKKSKMKLGNKGLNAFGRIFKKHGFKSKRGRLGTFYLVKRLNG